jgi:hypothetical protein
MKMRMKALNQDRKNLLCDTQMMKIWDELEPELLENSWYFQK